MAAFGALLLADFVVAAVMLVTDKNLQTDFGAVAPYYLHWYGLLAMGVLDLLFALPLLAFWSPMMVQRTSLSVRSRLVGAAFAWTVLAIVASLGIVVTYSQVGFSSAGQFAQYLFGVTAYPGAFSYIPGLYDLLVALYIVTAGAGALAFRHVQSGTGGPTPA